MLHLIFTIILALCLAILLRYSERNRAHKVLAVIILIWVFIFGARAFEILSATAPTYVDTISTLNFSSLALGVPCFLLLLAYPMLIINPKLIYSRAAIYINSPAVIAIVIYIAYHLIAGLPINEVYTLTEAWEARFSATIIMRVIILLLFIAAITISLGSIWRLIPTYQKYVLYNYADPDYNIDWIRKFCIGTALISAAYFFYLLYCDYYIAGIVYMIITSSVFVVIMDNVIKSKTYDLPEDFSVEWDVERGWNWVYQGENHFKKHNHNKRFYTKFYKWINEEKPYLNAEFSASKVEEVIPGLDFTQLNAMLQEDGYNFQSFVRKCRIDEAVRIMSNKDNEFNIKEIAYKVGFSHHSSFSRAFTTEKGYSPSQFLQ